MADFLIIDDNKKTKTDNDVNNKASTISSGSFIDQINDYFISMQNIKTVEKVIFFRLMSTMTNSGLGVLKSVVILEKQEKNPVFKKILNNFIFDLKEGKNLSECMESYPKTFTDAEIGIVKSGEKTGQLNGSLKDLADQIEKIASISGKIKSAMIYPSFIIGVVILVVGVMMTVVVPKLLEIFENKADLPTSTKILVGISDFFINYWLFGIIGLIMFYILFRIWKNTPDGKYLFDELILKTPLVGNITQKFVLSKFSRVFSGLVGSGVSVVESLKITSEAVGNEVYKQRILLLAEDIKGGIRMWESLDGDKLFPEMMVQMIQVGEETAKLDKTILKVADFYDDQVDNIVGALNKLLEPIIIVTLAVVVGLIALGIMQPIMNLADSVGV